MRSARCCVLLHLRQEVPSRAALHASQPASPLLTSSIRAINKYMESTTLYLSRSTLWRTEVSQRKRESFGEGDENRQSPLTDITFDQTASRISRGVTHHLYSSVICCKKEKTILKKGKGHVKSTLRLTSKAHLENVEEQIIRSKTVQ